VEDFSAKWRIKRRCDLKRLIVKGQRFGFVRVQDVVDVANLEKRLNIIWIGTWKLRINKPKYKRLQEVRKEWNGNHKPRKQQKEWRQRDQHQTYAHVVVKENKRRVQGVKAQGLVHVRV